MEPLLDKGNDNEGNDNEGYEVDVCEEALLGGTGELNGGVSKAPYDVRIFNNGWWRL